MFNLRLRDQRHSFILSVHQDNDFNLVNVNSVGAYSNIDIKYRQSWYTLDLDIFKLIREYEYQDHKYHDMDRLLNEFSDFPNETTSLLPIFRPHFDYRINNSRFYEHMSRVPNYRLSKRIELGENINIRSVFVLRTHAVTLRNPTVSKSTLRICES